MMINAKICQQGPASTQTVSLLPAAVQGGNGSMLSPSSPVSQCTPVATAVASHAVQAQGGLKPSSSKLLATRHLFSEQQPQRKRPSPPHQIAQQ
ncbi:hypothetical protein CBR_g23821 [Chara braunii]|uniref:Uncharacterized protein n=1 Tax=Chara braunii TaxID=69332 RepID=A0A388JVM8_CHABU|nr:hypothetical protein CBR_g23821 [Chara braunii]|eukprot:GBG61869.1 hypothetical protein CBR_g23821 [Chara braunii]